MDQGIDFTSCIWIHGIVIHNGVCNVVETSCCNRRIEIHAVYIQICTGRYLTVIMACRYAGKHGVVARDGTFHIALCRLYCVCAGIVCLKLCIDVVFISAEFIKGVYKSVFYIIGKRFISKPIFEESSVKPNLKPESRVLICPPKVSAILSELIKVYPFSVATVCA